MTITKKNLKTQKKKKNLLINKKSSKHYHFIGIGGISMSALAKFLANKNNVISGSDINPDIKIDGIKTFVGHNAKNINGCDVVVYNSAIQENNPEIIEARKKCIPLISRADLLAEIGEMHKNVISISGVHGKTTTTEMIAEVFIQAELNPTVHLGGISNCFNSNILIGGKKFFISEACEYKNSFLSLKNTVGVILNLEPEHLDFYKTFNNMKSSFELFANHSKIVISPIDLGIKTGKTIFIKDNSGYTAKNVLTLNNGKLSFDCFFKGKYLDNIVLNALGKHNVDNALACIAVARYFNISMKHIKQALSSYKGVKRRMEIIKLNPLIIHDYAHHPTELNSAIDAIKSHFKIGLTETFDNPNYAKILTNQELDASNDINFLSNQGNAKKLYVIFQPHTYSRTNNFKDYFIKVLTKADKLFLFKTYPAREKAIPGASAYNLYQKIIKNKNEKYQT